MTDASAPLHGSAFSYNGFGCLLLGPSGSGKSRLTVDAISLGAKLVADDQVKLELMMGLVAATAVPELSGIVELRGMALLKMNDIATKNVIHLVVELDPAADARLAELQKREYLGVAVPYLRLPSVPKTSVSMLLLYLKAMQENRVLPADWMPKRASA
jgi:HPr kinase/phosphorylase